MADTKNAQSTWRSDFGILAMGTHPSRLMPDDTPAKAGSPSFKPVKEFGRISISPSTELVFYADVYRGHPYVSIRTFLKSGEYTGPTKAGVTLTPEIVAGMIKALETLPRDGAEAPEKELARFTRRVGVELVLRVARFRDTVGIDLREWIDDANYKGWSKKGVRIPYGEAPRAVDCLKAMQAFLAEKPKPVPKPET